MYNNTILIQGLDASNTIETADFSFAELSAKADLFTSGLLGISSVVPAGNVGDSTIFQSLVMQVFNSQPIDKSRTKWVPFRLALDTKYSNYTDFAVQYPFEASGKRAIVPDNNLALLGKLYANRQFSELDKHMPPGTGAFAETVFKNIENQQPQNPIQNGHHITPNYLEYIQFKINSLYNEKYNPKIQKISHIIRRIRNSNVQPKLRGDFYNLSHWFEETWPLVRLWIDDYFSHNMQAQYDIKTRAATTHTVNATNFNDLEFFAKSHHFSQNTGQYSFLREQADFARQISVNNSNIDFSLIWELSKHEEFIISAAKTRDILFGNHSKEEQSDQLEAHISLSASHATDIKFDMSNFNKSINLLSKHGDKICEAAFLIIAADNGRVLPENLGSISSNTPSGASTFGTPIEYFAGEWTLRKKIDIEKRLKKSFGNLLRYHVLKHSKQML